MLFSFLQKRTHVNFKVVGLLGARTARYLLKLLSRYYFAKPPRAHFTVASNGKLVKKTFLTSLRFSFFPKRTLTKHFTRLYSWQYCYSLLTLTSELFWRDSMTVGVGRQHSFAKDWCLHNSSSWRTEHSCQKFLRWVLVCTANNKLVELSNSVMSTLYCYHVDVWYIEHFILLNFFQSNLFSILYFGSCSLQSINICHLMCKHVRKSWCTLM